MNYLEQREHTREPEYDISFWNAMKGDDKFYSKMGNGRNMGTDSYFVPHHAHNKYLQEVKKHSLFRQIGTTVNADNSRNSIWVKDTEDFSSFVPEQGEIPLYENIDNFTRHRLNTYKLATFTKVDEDFVRDATFNFEDYLIGRISRTVGRTETNAFINGTGVDMPTGILNVTGGAEIGVSTSALSYDDVIKLFFSVKAEYRENAVWLMSDETTLKLRTLKDSDGNYLWNHSTDTILGKNVITTEFMADEGKIIAFGDFSYYWVVSKMPLTVRTLKEKFVLQDQIGYLAIEFLDGKLIKPEAIKVLELTESK